MVDIATELPVTVVVITRNRCHRLRQCLHQLSQLPEQPHIIVVDNASSDNTATMVQLRFPSVSLVRLSRNYGAVARNIGVHLAPTPVVAFADDDSSWQPGALAVAVQHMQRYPRLGLIAARTLVGVDGRVDPICAEMAAAPWGTASDLPGPSVMGFLACATVVRRRAFLHAGGFDSVVFFMGEEARLAYDLERLGWGLAYCDDVVARHEPDSPEPGRALLARRNRALTSWMRRPALIALSETAVALAWAISQPRGLRSSAQLLRRLPAALARRQPPSPRVEQRLKALRTR
jgi:GT2 family glycosyltransferase